MYYWVEPYEIVGVQPFLRNRNDNFIWFSIIELNDFYSPLSIYTKVHFDFMVIPGLYEIGKIAKQRT